MRRVTKVAVEGLFGYVNHVASIRTSSPTILTAPNGAGKTHLLMLMRAALGPDIRALFAIPFTSLSLDFEDDHGLVIQRRDDENSSMTLRFIAVKNGVANGKEAVFIEDDLADVQRELPPYIRQLSNGKWFDSRTDRVMSREFIERRFGVQLNDQYSDRFQDKPQVLGLFSADRPILIDTKRLDAAIHGAADSGEAMRLGEIESNSGAARINEYTNQIRKEVIEARRSSIQETQSADLSFAARAIDAADEVVDEDELHKRYDEIVEHYENLARNALAIGEAPMTFPSQTTSTVRTILNVFLDDWERRLSPLLPLNEKITLLREILETKLRQSGKKTAMSPQGGLIFKNNTGRRLRVSSLSSGEQHLVALFTLLLFSAKPGSLVLIDEPEISLHAAWKHAFLQDIIRVSKLADLQIVLATHSSAIINGRWDLTEELSFPSYRETAEPDVDTVVDAEMDDLLG